MNLHQYDMKPKTLLKFYDIITIQQTLHSSYHCKVTELYKDLVLYSHTRLRAYSGDILWLGETVSLYS